MRYVNWATFYEGSSDALYLDVVLPKVIRQLIADEGTDLVEVPDVPAARLGRNGRQASKVALEVCAFKDVLDVVFIHSDTGGRNVESRLEERASNYCEMMHSSCNWPLATCIALTPRHETEAWILADNIAVMETLGYRGLADEIGLPATAREAERLIDPKQVLEQAISRVSGRRRRCATEYIFPAIAQRQNINALRQSASFISFEHRLRRGLQHLMCIA